MDETWNKGDKTNYSLYLFKKEKKSLQQQISLGIY